MYTNAEVSRTGRKEVCLYNGRAYLAVPRWALPSQPAKHTYSRQPSRKTYDSNGAHHQTLNPQVLVSFLLAPIILPYIPLKGCRLKPSVLGVHNFFVSAVVAPGRSAMSAVVICHHCKGTQRAASGVFPQNLQPRV